MPSTIKKSNIDSDSLSSMGTGGGDSSSDDARVQSTKTSTPATSVLGEDKRSISTTTTRKATLHRTAMNTADSEDDSELSQLDEEELGSQPAKKKLKLAEGCTEAGYVTVDHLSTPCMPTYSLSPCIHYSILTLLTFNFPPQFATIA